jgi:hypothetical protein
MTGAERIAAERQRQTDEDGENWSAAHDAKHVGGELARAAACYATPARLRTGDDCGIPLAWPWDWTWWKPTPNDRIRELEKAGALAAAEIDRLQREEELARVGRG